MNDSQLARFLPKVDIPEEGCWEWTASKKPKGYGQMFSGDKKVPPLFAHRASYEHFIGPIPEGMQIDHLCRNRGCVNPSHLEVVTPAENTRRGWVTRRTTHCNNGHLRTEQNTYFWKHGKACRVCVLDRYYKNRDRNIEYMRQRRLRIREGRIA